MSRDEISSNQKVEETDEETDINVKIFQDHEHDTDRGLYLKSIGGKYLSQNGKFIEMVETKTATTELFLINSETDEGQSGMVVQTKVGLQKVQIIVAYLLRTPDSVSFHYNLFYKKMF